VTSLIIFFVTYLSVSSSNSFGRMTEIDLQSFGFILGTIIIVVVNLENSFEIWYWTIWYHVALWGTIILYFLFHLGLYSTIYFKIFKTNYPYVGVATAVLPTAHFWLTLLLSCAIVLLPRFFLEFVFLINQKANFNIFL
jgi:phospholipid-translocating ATPase